MVGGVALANGKGAQQTPAVDQRWRLRGGDAAVSFGWFPCAVEVKNFDILGLPGSTPARIRVFRVVLIHHQLLWNSQSQKLWDPGQPLVTWCCVSSAYLH